MTTTIVPFSGNSEYQLEVSTNAIQRTEASATFLVRSGIRRITGVGTGASGTGTLQRQTPHGGESPELPYDLTSTDYFQFPDWTTIATEDDFPGLEFSFRAAYTATTGGIGSADTGFVNTPFPTPSPATIPNLTPSSVAAGGVLTIGLPRQVSSYTHRLLYDFGSIRGDLIANNVGTTYAWTVPMALLNQIPNAPSAPITITAVTFDANGVELGRRSATGIVFAPASAAPSITDVVLSDIGGIDPGIDTTWFIQNLSVLRVDSITSSAQYGATIAQSRLFIEGASLRVGDTRALRNSGVPMVVTARVWDSRGLSTSLPININVYPYFRPIVNQLDVYRADSSGNPLEDGEYLYANYSITRSVLDVGAGDRNFLILYIDTRELGGTTWTNRTDIVNEDDTTWMGSVQIGGGAIYDNGKSYEVRFRIRDASTLYLGADMIADRIVPTGLVSIDVNGTNVGIGKTWANGKLDVDGDVYASGYHGVGFTLTGDGTAANITISSKLRLPSTSDVSLSSTNHAFQIGPNNGVNLAMDNNEIMARNNGSASALGLNIDGGNVNLGNTSSTINITGRLGATHLPWAYAAGAVTPPAGAFATVALPSGRFTQPPILTHGMISGAGADIGKSTMATNVTETQFLLRISGATAVPLNWQAVQMSSGSASG